MRSIVFALLMVLFLTFSSISAHAEVYKCNVEGKTIYQQSPCGNKEGKLNLPPSPHERDYKNIARTNADVAHYKRIKGVEDAMYDGRVIPGMTEDQVLRSLGKPKKINNNGGHIQWVYEKPGNDTYVYFKDGYTY